MAEAFVPKTFWHYMILYPTLFVALGGSVPTLVTAVKAWYLEVNVSRVQIVEEQRRLWEANIECLAESPVYSTTVTKDITIEVTLCPSGDALLRYKILTDEGERISYNWIQYPGHDTLRQRQARVQTTLAGEKLTGVFYGVSKCIALHNNFLVRILLTEQGCNLEVVNLADLHVMAMQSIACETLCARVEVVPHT